MCGPCAKSTCCSPLKRIFTDRRTASKYSLRAQFSGASFSRAELLPHAISAATQKFKKVFVKRGRGSKLEPYLRSPPDPSQSHPDPDPVPDPDPGSDPDPNADHTLLLGFFCGVICFLSFWIFWIFDY